MEDVVAEDEGGRVTGEELLTEQKRLREALGPLLDDVREATPSSAPSPRSRMKAG